MESACNFRKIVYNVNCQAKINKNSHIKLSNYYKIKDKLLSVGIIQHSFFVSPHI